ncbi:MAG: hypothetical protein H6719_19405 [Sandaracinaceae bacterium]|nr:hypothetical protein [Sandaracinaceae bacterium]
MTGDSGVRVDSGGGTTDGGPGDDGGGGDDAGGGSDGGGMASCSNAVLDGTETDVDCGGDCPGCPTGDMCAIGADCLSASCVGETCAAPACDDGLQNGDETAIDCGGGTCPGCPVGTGCTAGSDCASGVCDPTSSTCIAAGCDDGIQNGDETDLDCGGSCTGCDDGDSCTVHADCTSGYCSATTMTCATPTCTDGVTNGMEIGVDCGGGACPGCGDGGPCLSGTDCASGICDGTTETCSAPTCTDGVMNGAETDVDCGGGTCTACMDGGSCTTATDCLSGRCDPTSMLCAAPTCTDSIRNGTETGVDCGGGTCAGCADGGPCVVGTDCASGVCDGTTMTCTAPTCTDGVRNAAETGVDCGGGTCPACGDGGGCASGADCTSGVCDPTTMTCLGASCSDSVMNGDETGVDCGGGSCPGCADGGPCATGTDCASGICDPTTMTCTAPSCTDGVRNGAETDIDCGGGTCSACAPGEDCLLGTDCSSGICGGGSMTCNAPTCSDGVQNGAETDVDCGGGTCAGCDDGEGCARRTDCAEGYCVARTCRTFRSCNEILMGGASTGSGIYQINPTGTAPFDVFCDMTTDGGGWTRIGRLAASTTIGAREIGSINRSGAFFSSAWVQGATSYTTSTNAGVNLGTTTGMLDATSLWPLSSQMRFSCNASDSRGAVSGDAIWTPSAAEAAAFRASNLGGFGYATAASAMSVNRNGAGFASVSAYPTSTPTGFWGNWHICGAGGGATPNAGGGGFQVGVCHNAAGTRDNDISNANQVVIGYHVGFNGLRLECTRDTRSNTELVDGTWMAWVR